MADRRTAIVATYSIVACDLEAGQWGVGVQSKFLAVGSVVPWAEPHVGAVATQSYANPRYGPDGLALLREGLVRRGGRRAADRGGRRPRDAAARRRRRPGRGGDVHRLGVPRLGRRPRGRRLRGPGQHPRLGGDRRRARRDVRVVGRHAARRAAHPLPRRGAAGRRRPPRPAVGVAARRRARRRLRRLSDMVVDLRVDDHERPVEELERLYGIHQQLFGKTPRTSGSRSTTRSARSCSTGSAGSATTARWRRRSSPGRAPRISRSGSRAQNGSIRSCWRS